MLQNFPIRTSIPVHDMQRAKQFYQDKLGLIPVSENQYSINYQFEHTFYSLVPSDSAGKGQYSLLSWHVEDIEAAVSALRARGVVFEEYDFGAVKTVDGIATIESDRVAWFKDSEGNLLALAQLAVDLDGDKG